MPGVRNSSFLLGDTIQPLIILKERSDFKNHQIKNFVSMNLTFFLVVLILESTEHEISLASSLQNPLVLPLWLWASLRPHVVPIATLHYTFSG